MRLWCEGVWGRCDEKRACSVCLCVYVCIEWMYVYVNVCLHVCMYVCIHWMYVYVCLHVCMYVCIQWMYVCMYVCLHVLVSMPVYS